MTDDFTLQPSTALPDDEIATRDWKLPEPRKFAFQDAPYPFFWHFSWRDERSCGFWFRVWGYGLHVSTKKREDALFSERYGYTKALYLFGLRFEGLKP